MKRKNKKEETKVDSLNEKKKVEMLPPATTSILLIVLTEVGKAVISFFTLRWLTHMFKKRE